MPADDDDLPCPNLPGSARHSSDDTASDGVASEDAPTATTSVADTDEDLDRNPGPGEGVVDGDDDDETDVDDDDDDDETDVDMEAASLYAISHYPQPASPLAIYMHLARHDARRAHSDIAASTRSLWVPDLDYREIHGRRYCGEYYMPNDEIEQLRLSLQHQVFLHVLGGDVTCVPLRDPKNILDVGTGTGEWPIRVAELFPNCEVVGTDISAIAETKSVPVNVFFEIEDAEDWDRPADHYDLIHFRCMEGAFRDWRVMYAAVLESLSPGGWIELLDFDSLESLKLWFAVFPADSPIVDLARDLEVAAAKTGRKRGIAHMDPQFLAESGFVDVAVVDHVIPMKVGEKCAGKLWLISCLDALEALCLRLLTQEMGWDPDKCKAACEQVARELADIARDPAKAGGLEVKARTVAARKPAAVRDSTQSSWASPAAGQGGGASGVAELPRQGGAADKGVGDGRGHGARAHE